MERVCAGFFFPNGAVDVLAPLVPVAVAFPESGLLGGAVEVEVATDLSWDGRSAGIVFTEELSCADKRGQEEKGQRRVGAGVSHGLILCGEEAEAIGKLEEMRWVRMLENGRVAERFNVPDSKSGVGATLPWVQIPPRPRLRGRDKANQAGGEM